MALIPEGLDSTATPFSDDDQGIQHAAENLGDDS